MSLRIYNTLSRALEDFSPLEPGHVRMYVCGITVYDDCHVGHARANVSFDVVQRWIKASGYRLTFVRNITDIEDKIIRRAVENGETVRALTDRTIAGMYRDFDALGIERPTHDPRATDYVPQMLDIVRKLEAKGLAYRAEGGDVNYAVRGFPGYGKLSGKSLDELHAGERVAVLEGKEDPLDFVLWKAAKPTEPACKNSLGARCSNPRQPPSALSSPAAAGDLPRLTSAASSNSTATASGVAKSLSMAALKRAAWGSLQSISTGAGATRSSAVYRRRSAPRASSRCTSL